MPAMRGPGVRLGERYGRLEVTDPDRRMVRASGYTERVAEVRCDCGTVLEVRLQALRTGHTRSCGCLRRECASAAACECASARI